MDTMNGVVNQFNSAATHYAAAIQPYALKLFLALFFIDVLVTAIQFMVDQADAPHYVGKLFRHLLYGGFMYLMIVNAYPWMSAVLQSFSQIGASATGLPSLNPRSILQIGGTMAQTIFNTPASAGITPNLEVAIVESASAFFILLSFVIAAAALMLTLIEAYLVMGGAVLLLGFGGSRWTAPIAEGYFGYVVRVGTRLLFFYLVLGIGVQAATQWQAALISACHPIAEALPWYATYGVPPKTIMTTVCSNAIPVNTMLNLVAMSVVFVIVTIAVPYTAAGIVSGTVGLALSHAFEAAYVAQTVVRPIATALQTGFDKLRRASAEGDRFSDAALLTPMNIGQNQHQLGTAISATTTPLASSAKNSAPTAIIRQRGPSATTPVNRANLSSGNGATPTTADGRQTRLV